MPRLCLVSGGTGGHLMPALVLARSAIAAGWTACLIREGREVERELLRRELPSLACDDLPPARGGRLGLPLWLCRAIRAARATLRRHAIDAVVSTGGCPSLPVGIAARSLRLPLFLLEQNAVQGRANRWLAPFATRIYLGLPAIGAMPPRARWTGTPVRAGFGLVDRDAARRSLGLATDRPVVLVTGGSQGARVLNEVVPSALCQVGGRLQVMHLSGLGNEAAVRQRYAAAPPSMATHVRPVAAEMDRLFAAADLIVCRGGGTTVAELAVAGRPAVIVPYPHHRDRQQWHNADVLQRVGAAVVVDQRRLEPAMLAAQIGLLLADPVRLAAMGHSAAGVGSADAATAILDDIALVLGVAAPARSLSADRVGAAGLASSREVVA